MSIFLHRHHRFYTLHHATFFMRRITVVALLLAACSGSAVNEYNKFLQPCNRVNIVVFNGGDTLHFDTQDSTGIEILTGLISGDNSATLKDTCAAQGRLQYMQDSVQLFSAAFAVTPASNDEGCNYIAYADDDNRYTHVLSARAKKLLGTVLQQAGEQ